MVQGAGKLVAVALLASSGALTGCGASAPSGPAVFSQSCSGCHSLIGNEALHRQGGDLVGYRFTREVLLQYAGEMPVPKPLISAQLSAVVDYVLKAERRASAGGH